MPNRLRLTYANVASTLALFLALGGGAAFAADRIHSGDIAPKAVRSSNLAPGAVRTANVLKRAIVSGKLALGAVRSNQIGDGAVDSKQIAGGAVGTKQIGTAAVVPSNLQFPVSFVASPNGGSVPVADGPDPYPLVDGAWLQKPGEINVVFGAAVATLAYDGSGPGFCQVFFEIKLNGQQVGDGEVSTESTVPQRVEQSVGAQPQIDPVAPITNQLSIRTGSNGGCTAESTIDSTRFRVVDFG